MAFYPLCIVTLAAAFRGRASVKTLCVAGSVNKLLWQGQ